MICFGGNAYRRNGNKNKLVYNMYHYQLVAASQLQQQAEVIINKDWRIRNRGPVCSRPANTIFDRHTISKYFSCSIQRCSYFNDPMVFHLEKEVSNLQLTGGTEPQSELQRTVPQNLFKVQRTHDRTKPPVSNAPVLIYNN